MRVNRRRLRDESNPLSTPDSIFSANYRLSKSAFLEVLNEITPFVKETSIALLIKLAACLRFLAEGSFQRSVGKDTDIALGRNTVSKILSEIINALETVLCPKWIKLDRSAEDLRKCKLHFVEKFGIPGVIGCIDGTHVALVKPLENEHLFYNRKGYFSINAIIICDSDMVIQAEDASRPGSSHDAFVFNMSNAKQHYFSKYEAGDRGSWLLGDSGFGIEAFLLTPYRDPNPRSPQHRHYQIEDFLETESTTQPEEIFEENTELEENTNLNNVGRNLRDSIANNLIL
ncbi:PREDICTED: putative nuclease HARBI1 [Rhagoletis zephyria]|uniref:putative nuclease HARBI1 n=1 Tax=Rhagoletis zephyria TaxID=28612 RepID=UPI000811312B|nr:PREDICTED: putative nuclease HARBI1 [Rhagoletis zephyria]